MKPFLVALLTVMFLTTAVPVRADETQSFFGRDKFKHFVVSFILSTAAYNLYRTQTGLSDGESRAAAFGSTMLAGLVKEWADEDFSYKDLAADTAGAGLGVAVGIKFRF